jgi:hypothetical protein
MENRGSGIEIIKFTRSIGGYADPPPFVAPFQFMVKETRKGVHRMNPTVKVYKLPHQRLAPFNLVGGM